MNALEGLAEARESALIYHTFRRIGSRPMANARDAREEFRNTLATRFDGATIADQDLRIALAVGDWPPLACALGHAGLVFDDALVPEATFFFDSAETALELLCGDGDVMQAFMEERFRSDGGLTWVFVLLSAFRGVPLEVPP